MPISVTCGSCQAKFSLKDEFAGRKVRCSSCQAVIEVPAADAVLKPDGQPLGRFRKDYFANILRKRWDGFDSDDRQICVIREDSLILSLLRRFLGSFYGLLRTNFVIFEVGTKPGDGQLLGEFNRKFTLRDRYVLDLTHDRRRTFDRRMAIALGVLLDTAEKR